MQYPFFEKQSFESGFSLANFSYTSNMFSSMLQESKSKMFDTNLQNCSFKMQNSVNSAFDNFLKFDKFSNAYSDTSTQFQTTNLFQNNNNTFTQNHNLFQECSTTKNITRFNNQTPQIYNKNKFQVVLASNNNPFAQKNPKNSASIQLITTFVADKTEDPSIERQKLKLKKDYLISINSEEDFKSKVEGSQGLLIVDFYADWCPPCQRYGPILEKEAKQAKGQWKLVKIDVTKNEDLTDKAGITKLPTVFIYNKGEKIKEIEGAMDAENLKESIKPFLTQQQ